MIPAFGMGQFLGMNRLVEILRKLDPSAIMRLDDAAAAALFRQARWPDGHPVCPNCGSGELYRLREHSRPYKCKVCRTKYSDKSGSVFEYGKLPLQIYLAFSAALLCQDRNTSVLGISRLCGVNYRTGWRIAKRLRVVFAL